MTRAITDQKFVIRPMSSTAMTLTPSASRIAEVRRRNSPRIRVVGESAENLRARDERCGESGDAICLTVPVQVEHVRLQCVEDAHRHAGQENTAASIRYLMARTRHPYSIELAVMVLISAHAPPSRFGVNPMSCIKNNAR